MDAQRHQRHVPAIMAVTISALTLGIAGPAAAQFALGGGDALDANPSRVTGRTNMPTSVQDFRSRNLVVTGDVAGGRGFRGDVGYRAEGDFRGSLAGDDLFRFRADSAFSSPRAILSLREQFRFGQQLGVTEYRRGGPAVAPTQLQAPGAAWDRVDLTEGPIVDRIRLDQFTRAAAVHERTRLEGDTRTVGAIVDREGQPYYIEASPLRGIGYVHAMERHHTQGLSPLDRIRLREDIATGRVTTFGAPAEWRFEQLADRERLAEFRPADQDRRLPEFPAADPRNDRQPTDGIDTRMDPRLSDLDRDARQERDRLGLTPTDERRAAAREQDVRHREIIERIARRYAEAEDVELQIDPQVLRELDDEFEQLRDRLVRRDQRLLTRAEPWDLTGEPVEPDEIEDEDRPERPGDRLDVPEIDPGRAVPLLRHGQRVEQLTGVEQTRYNELIELAEQSLRDGEYFNAERQFLRALRFNPGEPLATAGMGHAQMGAGLYVASSLSLQRLFSTNPEMIDVRYDPALLPSRARLAQVVENLQGRLGERRDRDSIAFLLAYIGHQLEDRDLVEQGLSVFRDARPEGDILVTLLHGVWLGEDD